MKKVNFRVDTHQSISKQTDWLLFVFPSIEVGHNSSKDGWFWNITISWIFWQIYVNVTTY